MEELAARAEVTARGRRALFLMALAVVGLTAAGVLYLRPVTVAHSAVALSLPGKGSLNSVSFFDQSQGWATLGGPLPSSAPSSILRSSDGGGHWKLADVPGAPSYSFTRFFDPRHAMVSVNTPLGQVLYSTDDGGLNWKSLYLPGRRNDGFASFVFLDPQRGWYLEGTAAGPGQQPSTDVQQTFVLWRTLDGGHSWREVLTVDPAHPRAGGLSLAGFKSALSFSDEHHGSLLSTPSDTFYLTQDGGLSWEARSLPPFPYALVGGDGRGASTRLIRLSGLLAEIVSVTVPGSSPPALDVYSRVSDDGGETWSELRPLPANPSLGARPQFQDSRHWLLGEGRRIWRTADAGQSWEGRLAAIPRSLGISELQPLTGGLVWAVARDGAGPDRLLRSRDGGVHWEDRGAPSMQVVR
ncbi:MAG: hypothetical protein M3170_03315 [Candidatus Dormibacteraeota bacterium]|nr:hypothetical protein [Candidatus Dormibacteraeota bacterium]